VGVWKSRDEIKKLWSCEREFTPNMPGEKRRQLVSGWKRAVGRSFDWDK